MISILIVDDHFLVRKGLKKILEDEVNNVIVYEAIDGNDLMKKIHAEKFDMIICDISMPGRSGLELLEQIKKEYPKLPVLMLSFYPEDQYAVRVLKAGASGYISKDSASEELSKAIRQVLIGRRYISENLVEKLASNLDTNNNKDLHESLSNREFDVLKMIASGKKISDIAVILSLSVNTISTYRFRILEKMKLKNNAEIMHYVISNKIIWWIILNLFVFLISWNEKTKKNGK